MESSKKASDIFTNKNTQEAKRKEVNRDEEKIISQRIKQGFDVHFQAKDQMLIDILETIARHRRETSKAAVHR